MTGRPGETFAELQVALHAGLSSTDATSRRERLAFAAGVLYSAVIIARHSSPAVTR